MKLHSIIFSAIWFLSTVVLFSQPKAIKKADEYYNAFNYHKALHMYLDLEKKDDALLYITGKIADCYCRMGKTEEAVQWYKKAIEYPEVDNKVYYSLALQLRKQGEYSEADKYMKKYFDLSGKKNVKISNSPKLIERLKRDSVNYQIYFLPINSEHSEISPSIYNNKLVFSSNRKNISAIKRNDIRDGSRFYKLYESKLSDLQNLSQPKLFHKKLSSKYNDGAIAFNSDRNISFTTHNVVADSKEMSYLNIFVNHKTKGRWKANATAIPLLQLGYSYMHAFLALNDTKLFFVSDMPGGYGGLDIYVSDYKNGFLSPPKNLGSEVNSSGNESFPFVDSTGRLFYSSNKMEGLGGMDIFMAMPKDGKYIKSFNIGYPINTQFDDFGLIYFEEGKSGYFCSNRPGGLGKDDIYAFEQGKAIDYKVLNGIVYGKFTGVPVQDATVEIYDGKHLLISEQSNREGKFSFYINYQENLTLVVKKRYHNVVNVTLTQSNFDSNNSVLKVILEEY